MDAWIKWDRDSSCTSDFDEYLEHWQNWLHKVSSLHCNMLTKLIQCISTKVWNLPYYNGLENVNLFLDKFERDVPKEHWLQVLSLALWATPGHRRGRHKGTFTDWKEYRWMMKLRFGYANTHMIEKYTGKDDSCEPMVQWIKEWGEELQSEWVHIFSHILDTILMNWYL